MIWVPIVQSARNVNSWQISVILTYRCNHEPWWQINIAGVISSHFYLIYRHQTLQIAYPSTLAPAFYAVETNVLASNIFPK